MNKLFSSKKANFWKSILMVCLFQLPFFAATAFGQFSVTGRVVEETGEPFPGVYVLVRGTSLGTATDVNGSYTINVPDESSVLQFTFLGYNTQEIQVGSQRIINVTLMEDAQQFEELVVTALGITRERRALSYAISDVNASDIQAANSVNPILALQGRAAGVAVSGSVGGTFGVARIQVRGVSTISGNNTQPIYVVDGVILDNAVREYGATTTTGDFGNQLNNLNPEDFESVTILKGAAATALYGSRGLHGAVVITTKRPDRRAGGVGISVSQTVGVDWVYAGPDFQYEYGPGNRAGGSGQGARPGETQNQFVPNFGYRNTGTLENPVWTESLRAMQSGEYSGSYGPRYDGRLVEDYDGNMIPYSPNKKFFTDAFELGWNTATNVTMSGGNETTNFLLSNSYTKRTGWSPKNDFSRYNLLLRAGHSLAPFLRAEGSISFAQSTATNPPSNLASQFQRNGWKTIYNTGKYKHMWDSPHGGLPIANDDPNGNLPAVNLWWNINNIDTRERQYLIMPIARLIANVSDFTFMAEGNMTVRHTTSDRKALGTGYANIGTANGTGGQYELSQNLFRTQTLRLSGAYNRTVGDFDLGATVGGEWYFNRGTISNSVNTAGGLVAPGQFFIGNSREARGNGGSESGMRQTSSVYFLINTSWRNQLYLDITGRNDWSSTLVYSNATGNYSYFYPSVGGSWIFTETFDTPAWMFFGKLRASWAQVGNDTGAYTINQTYSAATTELPTLTLVQRHTFSNTINSPSLKPERKNAFELGTDLAFVNNRVGFEFTYYKENTLDQIIQIAAPAMSGISNQRINAGNVQNSGIEIVLRGSPVRTSDFRWDVTLMYSHNRNKIVELHPETGEYMVLWNAAGDFRTQSVAYVGGDYGTLISDVKPKRDENGNKLLLWHANDRTGYYARSNEWEKVGKIEPDFIGSITNTFGWKGITASVLLDVRWGGHMASYTNLYGFGYGLTKNSMRYRDAKNGGMTFTSIFDEKRINGHDGVFHDGVIPEGIFDQGVTAIGPDGNINDLSGLSYQQAIDRGFIDPAHGSSWNQRVYEWATFTLNDDWFSEVKYIGIRQITLGYTIPNRLTNRLGISNLRVAVEAQNVGYLYNSLPNNLNPQSFGGNANNRMFFERLLSPYVASYNFSLRFNI